MMPDAPGGNEPENRVRNRAMVAGRVVAWLAVVPVVGLSSWIVIEVDSQRQLIAFWGLVMSAVALGGAVIPSKRARIASGTIMSVFAFVGGFSIGGLFSPGALLMLVAATLPDEAGEAWVDRFVAIVLVPVGLLVAMRAGLTGWALLLAPMLAAAVMWRTRRLGALPWSLVVLPAGYAIFDVGYRFLLRGD